MITVNFDLSFFISEFRYTGCLGNKNNFPSMNVCKRQCHHDWNNFAAMRLVDKKTGKAIVKAHVSSKSFL